MGPVVYLALPPQHWAYKCVCLYILCFLGTWGSWDQTHVLLHKASCWKVIVAMEVLEGGPSRQGGVVKTRWMAFSLDWTHFPESQLLRASLLHEFLFCYRCLLTTTAPLPVSWLSHMWPPSPELLVSSIRTQVNVFLYKFSNLG